MLSFPKGVRVKNNEPKRLGQILVFLCIIATKVRNADQAGVVTQ